jgi:hypothetical protein
VLQAAPSLLLLLLLQRLASSSAGMGVALHRTIIVIIGLGCFFGAWSFLACLLFTYFYYTFSTEIESSSPSIMITFMCVLQCRCI